MTFCIQAMGILLLLCVAAVAVRAAWGMYVKLTRATAGQEAAEVQLAALKAQQAEVAASVAELSSERGWRRKYASVLGWQSKGKVR